MPDRRPLGRAPPVHAAGIGGCGEVAAAAAVVLVVAVGAVIGSGSSDDSTVIAAAALEPLGDAGEGSAELVERDGLLQLQLSTSGIDSGDGFLEVWVINTDVTQLVSLGPLRNDGIYELPPGLDPADTLAS